MQYKNLNTSMMSGTSMDGIDISLTRTNGTTLSNLNNYFYEYNKTEKNI